MHRFKKIDDFRWELPMTGGMRVPGRVYATEKMLEPYDRDQVADQVANVAWLPGIVGNSMAMPDAHSGYGFPIGGVAATDVDTGVISPAGIGYDISCGVRLLRSDLAEEDLRGKLPEILDAMFYAIPSGVGIGGKLRLDADDMHQVFRKGARWAVEHNYGVPDDLDKCEDRGELKDADADGPSDKALERGRDQLGTLGSGNHFAEVQIVDRIYDNVAAAAFGLFPNQITVLIHTGSRGAGYQICDDSLKIMEQAAKKYQIKLPDKQLACVPVSSKEGKAYWAAMCSGANFARANRQVITQRVRDSFMRTLSIGPRDLGMDLVYDVCHNMAKIEEHTVDGKARKLCVHRKGATRAFPAGHPDVPEDYRSIGQPVLLPGSMGTYSYVLVGSPGAMTETFGSIAHGAGRRWGRKEAARHVDSAKLMRELKFRGIEVRTDSPGDLSEEAPEAYKDVNQVVDVCEGAGLARRVARMRPIGVVKG